MTRWPVSWRSRALAVAAALGLLAAVVAVAAAFVLEPDPRFALAGEPAFLALVGAGAVAIAALVAAGLSRLKPPADPPDA